MLASTAVAHADLRVLLMSVFHLTGDQRWLNDPYRPVRLPDLGADPQAGLSNEAAVRLRVVAAELLEMNIQPVIDDPGTELLCEMMCWCLGEDVPSDYAASMRAELDFTQPTITAGTLDPTLSDGQRHLAEHLPHYATWTRLLTLHVVGPA